MQRHVAASIAIMFSALSLLSCASVLLATFSPALVLCYTTLSDDAMTLIIAIFAAFLWACAMSIVALIWAAIPPLQSQLWLLMLYAVPLQEFARWSTWALYERLMSGLRSAGLEPSERGRTAASVMPAAVASGLGAGVMQVLTLHGDILAGSMRPGTLYSPACSSLSIFALDALTNLASIVLNVLLSVLGWTAAYPRKSRRGIGAIVLLHLLASGATLLNTQLPSLVPEGAGCAYSLPSLYSVVIVAAFLTSVNASATICAPRRSELIAGATSSTGTGGARTGL